MCPFSNLYSLTILRSWTEVWAALFIWRVTLVTWSLAGEVTEAAEALFQPTPAP